MQSDDVNHNYLSTGVDRRGLPPLLSVFQKQHDRRGQQWSGKVALRVSLQTVRMWALCGAALLSGCSHSSIGDAAFVALAFVLTLGWPLSYLVRGKLEDWRSLAEYAVLWEPRGASEDADGCHGCAEDSYARARRCEAAIPKPLRSRLLRRARLAAGLAALLVLAGCSHSTEPEYFQDRRTGLCFATLQTGAASPGLWAQPAVSWVPCTGPVVGLIPLEVRASAPRDKPVPAIVMGGVR